MSPQNSLYKYPNRKIIHIDLDAFYCAVEQRRDPTLEGIPFAVGGRPDERGVISSCSYPARRLGIRSAMPTARALRIYPGLQILTPHHSEYSQASRQVMEHLYNLTPFVEQISIDEAFLDVSELPPSGEDIARQLQSAIRNECKLPSSLGVATNKLVAKIANDFGKASAGGDSPPNAITVVPAGDEAEFLAPLPVEALWGIGPKTAERLAEREIYSIGQLAVLPVADLVQMFGKNGHDLYQRARGIDERPIVTEYEPKSFSQEITFARDVREEAYLRTTLKELSEGVSERLKSASRAGVTIKLKIRWPDFTTITRQITLPVPTDQELQIYNAALQLFEKVWRPGKAVRLIGVGVSGLKQPIQQLSLWENNEF
jgi:DNA polymerase-4